MKTSLPVLIINDVVLLPYNELKIDLEDNISKKVISLSENYFNNYVYIICTNEDIVKNNKFPIIGLVAQIKLKIDMPNGMMKVTLKGTSRAKSLAYHEDNGVYDTNITVIESHLNPQEEIANVRTLKKLFLEYLDSKETLGNSIVSQIEKVNELDKLTDQIAGFIPISYERQLGYFRESNPLARSQMLIDDINFELSLIEYENNIDDRVESNLEENQKEFILKEKLRIISEELGIGENPEIKLLEERYEALDAPEHIKKRLRDELDRYKLCNGNSPEIGILRNYIDTLLSLPWNKTSRDNTDIKSVKEILDKSHYGLDYAKDRILEYIATKKFSKTKTNPVLCLVGPPGVGKTSIAKAISVALKRKCVKISVGGINDEAEITGHRRAYVGAAPGKIITGIKKAGVNNPVFIIDEIDKMTKDIKGDPASSLLDILDKEQNDRFIDHFIEEEFDLSKVMFILTANYIDKIPSELKDRLEIITLSSYTLIEKYNIVKDYLLPKLSLEYNVSLDKVKLTDETIYKIINNYTKESGVRELERLLRKLFRKYIYYFLMEDIEIDCNDLSKYLGSIKYTYQENYPNTVGMVNALSYSPLGGQLVKIESAMYPGKSRINYSNDLGDVMKQSIDLAFIYIKSHYRDFKIDFDDLVMNDFYVNFHNNNLRKEGPSAGINIVTSILSSIKDREIPNNIAMMGEITLSGKIIRVGGIKEKLLLAISNNIKTIYLPKDNENDIVNLKDEYKEKLNLIFVDNYMEIYKDLLK